MKKALFAVVFAGLSSLAFGWDASSYKQTGRVAQWDGLENAGYHRHDASATAWKDLAGWCDLTLTANGSWGDAWLNVDGLSAKGPVLPRRNGTAVCLTMEVVYRMTNQTGGVVFETGVTSMAGALDPRDPRRFYFTDNGTKFRFWGDGGWRKVGNITYTETDHVAQCRYENKNPTHYLDGKGYTKDDNHNIGDASGHVTLGARTDANNNPWWGRVYAVRLYDHSLTTDEITQHRIIDEARFFGKYPAKSVYVMADDERCGAPEPAYGCQTGLTVGNEYVFTAPAEYTNATEGVAATCAGWELYEEGQTEPIRTSADAGESATSCTVVYSTNVRLRWKWTNVRYRIRASVVGGTVNVAEQWVAAGTAASVTATGAAGLTFVGWTGEDTSLSTTAAWAALDGPKDIVGAFRDTDVADAVAVYYVAKGGSDANDGTSLAQALATPAAALAKAQTVDGLVYVVVGPGTYAQQETLAFGGKSVRMIGAGRDLVRFDFCWVCRGVYIDNAQARLEGVEIYRAYQPSTSGQHGGGVRITAGKVEDCRLLACDVGGGWTYGYGGGVAISGSGVVSGCEITQCRCINAYTHGNAADVNGGVLTNCNIFANDGGTSATTVNNGSAVVYLRSGTVVACKIHDNVKQTCPGVHQIGGTLANCLIYNNVGGSGEDSGYGAGGVCKSSGDMYHCTVWGNVLNLDATGISGVVQTGGTAKNNITTGNGPAESTAGSCRVTGGTFAKNAIDMALTSYADNALGDVKLLDAGNADFRLASKASAAYQYGLPVAGQTTDFAGLPRDATHPSVGAYEYDPSVEKFGVDLQLAKNDYKPGETVTANAVVSGADPAECTLAWTVDGTPLAETGAQVEIAGLTPGTHAIAATVSKAGESPASNTATVKFWPLKTYVGGNGPGTEPYDTP